MVVRSFIVLHWKNTYEIGNDFKSYETVKSNVQKEAVVMVVLEQLVTNGMAIRQLVEGNRETVGFQHECTNTLICIFFNFREFYLCICNYVCYNKSKHEKKLIINHIYIL